VGAEGCGQRWEETHTQCLRSLLNPLEARARRSGTEAAESAAYEAAFATWRSAAAHDGRLLFVLANKEDAEDCEEDASEYWAVQVEPECMCDASLMVCRLVVSHRPVKDRIKALTVTTLRLQKVVRSKSAGNTCRRVGAAYWGRAMMGAGSTRSHPVNLLNCH
jgi:hypothetical protein